jgi:anti-sigma factor (TIGR02949 family)
MTGPGSDGSYCERALQQMYEFLDNEIDTASGDAIRRHLAECEPCLDRFDFEQAVKAVVRRCCSEEHAPEHLRARIVTQLTVIRRSL